MARLAAPPPPMTRYAPPPQASMLFPTRGVLPPGAQVPITNPYVGYPPPEKMPYMGKSAQDLNFSRRFALFDNVGGQPQSCFEI